MLMQLMLHSGRVNPQYLQRTLQPERKASIALKLIAYFKAPQY